METIKYYKLISPYPEDETLDCALTMADMDQNFLTFKDYDIKTATFDKDAMDIGIIRNNGEEIHIDISGIEEDIQRQIESVVSGLTPSSIELEGELQDDGTLILKWRDPIGDHEIAMSGFVTEVIVAHDETLTGAGTEGSPLRLSNLEKTGKYKTVLGIVSTLPDVQVPIGARYVTKNTDSIFGRLYSKEGLDIVKAALASSDSQWRIPTKEDWDKLLQYADGCEICPFSSDTIGEYTGVLCGKNLKSMDYWEGNVNYDTLEFAALPAGYVPYNLLVGAGQEARFWTDTQIADDENVHFIKGFSYDHDDSLQEASDMETRFSIRLVTTIGKTGISNDYFDVSEANDGETYTDLASAIAAIPENERNKHTGIKFKKRTPAMYSVVREDNLTTAPDIDWSYMLSEGLNLYTGTYTSDEILEEIHKYKPYDTLPTVIGETVVYAQYIDETIDHPIVTYNVWHITCDSVEDIEDVEYQIMSPTWESDVNNQTAIIGDSVNILGNTYHVVNYPEINQAWITTNLIYNAGASYCDQYTYEYEGIVAEKYTINHWNGRDWEKKELDDGDEFNVREGDKVFSYTCVTDENGNQHLVRGVGYQIVNGQARTIIDSGWY